MDNLLPSAPENPAQVQDLSSPKLNQTDSLEYWANLYFQVIVLGSPDKTIIAKKSDLSKFISFFKEALGSLHISFWTPSVTKQFQKCLLQTKNYKATSINRVFATLRHFARWVNKQKEFVAYPMEGVKDIATDDPDWNGLTDIEITKLKSAVEQRAALCKHKHQNPTLETAVFFVLLYTGLREAELVSLNIEDYHSRGFHNVKRKGSNISKKVPLPGDAREHLDRYLATRQDAKPTDPLFTSRYNNRLATRDVIRICKRIHAQASAYLSSDRKFSFTPHKLRHTFLKRVADKHGLHVAQKMSGNVSISEIFRYTKPSQAEIDQTAEELF